MEEGTMATVWATMVGYWTKDPSTGWSHTFAIKNGLHDLAAQMAGAKLAGGVTRVGIVAHGDQAGVVRLDRQLTTTTVGTFAPDFMALTPFLTPDAMLIFYSCIAGEGQEGSRLLTAISGFLPGRTIVGFEMYGFIGPAGLANAPGNMDATSTGMVQLAVKEAGKYGKLGPWAKFAKWAKNGRIIRIPYLEQSRRPKKTCANPSCPGHSDAGHACPGYY
jgi:hypothetical protein